MALSLGEDARRLESGQLSEQVYRVVRDAISNGTLEEHRHLVQNRLADDLQVSRTPVRDALLRLSQEGVVRAVGGRGYVVEPLTPRDVLDIYEVRIALEVDAAAAALPWFGAAALAELEEVNQIMAGSTDKAQVFDLNRQFHRLLVERTPNRLVVRLLADLWAMPVSRRVYMRQVGDSFRPVDLARDHEPILEALRSRSSERLHSAALAHLIAARDVMRSWISEDRTVSS